MLTAGIVDAMEAVEKAVAKALDMHQPGACLSFLPAKAVQDAQCLGTKTLNFLKAHFYHVFHLQMCAGAGAHEAVLEAASKAEGNAAGRARPLSLRESYTAVAQHGSSPADAPQNGKSVSLGMPKISAANAVIDYFHALY